MAKQKKTAVPNPSERISPLVNTENRTYPSDNINPTKINSILKNAMIGDVSAQYELYSEIEIKDAHIRNVSRIRKSSISQLGWEIQQFSDDAQDIKKKEYINELFSSIPMLSDLHLDMLDAIWKGIAISEIIWEVKNGITLARFDWIPQYMLVFPIANGTEDPEQVRIKQTISDLKGVELFQDKFVVHRPRSLSSLTRECGLFRSIVGGWFLKNYALKDWSVFVEKFGNPFLKGTYPQGTKPDSPDLGVLREAMEGFISNSGGMFPDNMNIEPVIVNQSGRGDGLHAGFVKYWNEAITLIGLGQIMTTGQDGSGSRAKSEVGERVDAQLMRGDAASLEATYRDQIIKPAIKFQFGDDEGLPHFKFINKDPIDLEIESRIDDVLVNKIKLPLSESYFYEKYNRPRPEKDETIISGESSGQFFNKDDHGKLINKSLFDLEQPTKPEIVKYKNERMRDMIKRENKAVLDGVKSFGVEWTKGINKAVNNAESFEDMENWLIEKESETR